MKTWDKCKNCGGEYGLHNSETNQCPLDGREAPLNQRQIWKSTIFENDDTAALTERIAALESALTMAERWIVSNLNAMETSMPNPPDPGTLVRENQTVSHIRALLNEKE